MHCHILNVVHKNIYGRTTEILQCIHISKANSCLSVSQYTLKVSFASFGIIMVILFQISYIPVYCTFDVCATYVIMLITLDLIN